MLHKVKTSVVNLDKYIDNYNNQLPYLENIGLKPERFSAINAIDDEHNVYKNRMTFFSKYFTPKSTIGCSMSHILLCEKLYNEELLLDNVLKFDLTTFFKQNDVTKYDIVFLIHKTQYLNPKKHHKL